MRAAVRRRRVAGVRGPLRQAVYKRRSRSPPGRPRARGWTPCPTTSTGRCSVRAAALCPARSGNARPPPWRRCWPTCRSQRWAWTSGFSRLRYAAAGECAGRALRRDNPPRAARPNSYPESTTRRSHAACVRTARTITGRTALSAKAASLRPLPRRPKQQSTTFMGAPFVGPRCAGRSSTLADAIAKTHRREAYRGLGDRVRPQRQAVLVDRRGAVGQQAPVAAVQDPGSRSAPCTTSAAAVGAQARPSVTASDIALKPILVAVGMNTLTGAQSASVESASVVRPAGAGGVMPVRTAWVSSATVRPPNPVSVPAPATASAG
jgi:hypothetical protein